MPPKNLTLNVQGHEIRFVHDTDFISLTDIAKRFGDVGLIDNWLRNKNTVEFLGVWEELNNPDFNSLEFEGIMKQSGLNRFSLSVKEWNQKVNGIGLRAKAGIFGGTYAHADIALEFASWVSPEFRLFLIKELQRLKREESEREESGWNVNRVLTKINYRIHTDAIRDNLAGTFAFGSYVYANEADMLNKIVYGKTHKEWKDTEGKTKEGNQRDNGTVEQLVVMASLEAINAMLIDQKKSREERERTLYEEARKQMGRLLKNPSIKKLK